MGTQSLKIDWDNFPNQVANTFRDIYRNDKFFDVTLVSEDLREVKAHRIVISSCSSALRRILYKLDYPNPVLYLRGIKHHHLEAVLEFLYLGSVTVSQSELKEILDVAKQLNIHQLTACQTESSEGQRDVPGMRKVSRGKQTDIELFSSEESKEDEGGDNDEDMDYYNVKDDCEVEEGEEYLNSTIKTSNSDYEDDETKEFPCRRCDLTFYSYLELQVHKKSAHPGNKFPCPQCQYVAGSSADRKKHIENIHERKKHPCPLCDFEASSKSYLKVHLETHEGVKYECQICHVQVRRKD